MGLKMKIVLKKSLKELGFKMMMSSSRVNIFGGKRIIYFLIVFSTYFIIWLLKFQL